MNKKKLINEWELKGYHLEYKNNEFICFTKNISRHIEYRFIICLDYNCIEMIPTSNGLPHTFVRMDRELSELINLTMTYLYSHIS